MLTNKLLKCNYKTLGFTKGRCYEIYLDRYGHYCVYDDNHDERHNPFNTDNSMFEVVDVNTNTESYKANDGVANYTTSDLTKQIGANIKVIIDEYFNLDTSYGDRADLNCSGAVDGAINIVKEHKCIWKGVYNYSQESTHYTLSCGNKYLDDYMGEDIEYFKYCPYCGGEIEFSEVEL